MILYNYDVMIMFDFGIGSEMILSEFELVYLKLDSSYFPMMLN